MRLWLPCILISLSYAAQGQGPPLSERHRQGMAHLQQAAVHSENQRDAEALVELEQAYALLPPSYGLAKLLGEAYLKTENPKQPPPERRWVWLRLKVGLRLKPPEEVPAQSRLKAWWAR